MRRRVVRRPRHGQIPLWSAVTLFALLVVLLCVWTYRETRDVSPDGRQTIVFWDKPSTDPNLDDDTEILVRRFEKKFPQYHVIMSKSVARDLTGDAQRLMSAIAGGVPPDVVYFDRFAIGEWAARGALTDLRPYLEKQEKNDLDRLDLSRYYDYTVAEASYRPPGSSQTPGVYGIPCTTDIRLMFVNSDVLRQAGLVDAKGDPRPPKNWDELRDYANKLTMYRAPGDKHSGIVRLGFGPNSGNSWLYMYAWQAGGEMMNADRTRVTMDSPNVVRALRYMTDIYDDLGGVGQVQSFTEAQQGGALDPFLLGRMALKIDGDWSMSQIADWKPDLDFMIIPAPIPQDRIDAGHKPVAWSGGFAYVIPTSSHQKDGAFELIKYLRTWESVNLIEQCRREQREAEGRLFLPHIDVNRDFFARILKASVQDNPHMPQTFKRAYQTISAMLPNTLIRPVTPVGQLLWGQHVRAYDAATRHVLADEARSAGVDEIKYCLQRMQQPVQEALDKILEPPPPTIVNFRPYLWLYAAIVLTPFIAMVVVYRRRRRAYGYRAREVGASMLFASPWIVGFIVLVGGPILFSIVFSFTTYDVLNPARYVGWSNFTEVARDPVFYRSLFNTMYMVIGIPLGMAISLGVAMLLNHAVRGIGLYRAAYYMPVIMPLVALSLAWIWVFNPTYGLINSFLAWVLDTAPSHGVEHLVSRFTAEPFHFALPLWLQSPDWSKPSIILMNLWRAGGGMIIWLAGLQSISPELYEAAEIDGAGRWQRFRNVTLPMLSPYILFNLIIGLIGTMKMFEESYIMTEGGPADSTLFYAYYLFKHAFQYFRMGYASALAWILFLVVLTLTLTQLWLSKKWVHYEQA